MIPFIEHLDYIRTSGLAFGTIIKCNNYNKTENHIMHHE